MSIAKLPYASQSILKLNVNFAEIVNKCRVGQHSLQTDGFLTEGPLGMINAVVLSHLPSNVERMAKERNRRHFRRCRRFCPQVGHARFKLSQRHFQSMRCSRSGGDESTIRDTEFGPETGAVLPNLSKRRAVVGRGLLCLASPDTISAAAITPANTLGSPAHAAFGSLWSGRVGRSCQAKQKDATYKVGSCARRIPRLTRPAQPNVPQCKLPNPEIDREHKRN